MNRITRHSRITLILLFTALLWPHSLVRAQSPTPTPTLSKCLAPAEDDGSTQAGQKIKLYYMRQAGAINTMLTAFAKQPGSKMKDLLVANRPLADEFDDPGNGKHNDARPARFAGFAQAPG